MSLVLVYFDSGRAVACCDDRGICFNASGQAEAVAGRFPKFARAGRFLIGATGDNRVSVALMQGTARVVEANPQMKLRDLISIFQSAARDLWSKRERPANLPASHDGFEAMILGINEEIGDMQCTLFSSQDRFVAVELLPQDRHDRKITAVGAYGKDDWPLLERLTERMEEADRKRMPWVAACLGETLSALHQKNPSLIGAPSFYAALNTTGFVDLPGDFPPAPLADVSLRAHLVTTTKEFALNAAGRFFVGSITTPIQGQPDTNGNNDGGSGAQSGQLNIYYLSFATFQTVTPGGNGSKSNEGNITDGNMADSATYAVTGNSSAANTAQTSTNPIALPIVRRPISAKARVLYDVSTNSLNGGGAASRFDIDITYKDSAGTLVHNFVVVLGPGVTVAKAIAEVAIPPGASAIAINITANTLAADTGGSLTAHVYEFWVEALE